jgi:hypothetical protein
MRIYAVFAALSLLVYSRAFDNPFRQDDVAICRYVSTIGIQDVFRTTSFAFYRPGALAVFSVEHALFGENSGAYIVFNYVTHVLISLGMCLVLRRAGVSARGAFLAGGLFVLGVGHYGKKIMWACTSGPLFSAVLSLAALLLMFAWLECDRRGASGSGNARYAYPLGIAIALGIAPLFHEASLWTVPLILAVVLIYGPRDWRARARCGLPPVLVLTGWLAVLGFVSDAYPAYRIGWDALGGAPLYLVRYIGFMVVPLQQTAVAKLPGFLDPVASFAAHAQVLVGLAGVLVLAALVFKGTAPERLLSLWLVLWLVPFSMVRLPGTWLELRYLYCASIPYCGLLGLGFDVAGSRCGTVAKGLRRVVVVGLVLATVVLVLLLERQYDRLGG